MTGWMHAWSTCLASKDTTRVTPSTIVQDVSLTIRFDVTNILATMILGQQQEAI
jgi:hypothetical protein